ncbi:MAG TPA: ice-binding family protein [Bacteroidia bacterium]|nr:ice-binding family protein [Bacteroidia bacterium]
MKKSLHIAFGVLAGLLAFGNANAQAPDLGTANSFGIFTVVGAIDNVGNTVITGDAGTNVGAFNGFPPAIVIGQIHVADATSAQVAIDVEAAYVEMTAMPCGPTIGAGLGNGQVLIPDTYCISTAATLTGDLTFDGQGDPNALFFVKIDGAFSTAAFSNILTINGASACNIYWQVNGAVDFGANSAFQGVVLLNGQFTMLDGATLEGKGLARQGAIGLSNNTVNSCTPAPMPVNWAGFTAVQGDAGTVANLQWQTAMETNSDYFLVQHSADGIRFTSIGKLGAAGYSDDLRMYAYTDESPFAGSNYYRLEQVDQDGRSTFSTVQALTFADAATAMQVQPNPFSEHLVLRLAAGTQDVAICEWQLWNTLGTKVLTVELHGAVTHIATIGLPAGIYVFRLVQQGAVLQSGRLIAQH